MDLFDLNRSEASVINELVTMSFEKVGKGHSAYVFGDTEGRVVLKVFPLLNVGASKELAIIKKNPVLALLDQLSLRMENVQSIKWMRESAKYFVASLLSGRNIEQRIRVAERCIQGYEICIEKRLMTGLPTRVISNCISKLSIRGYNSVMKHLVAPAKIILQQRFHDADVAINVLQKICIKNNAPEKCFELVEKAVEYQLMMWRMGLVCKDGAFNIFENSIVLPDGCLQLHDSNDVGDLLESALRFIRAKEQDLHEVFLKIDGEKYPALLYDTTLSSVAETARKLYRNLPANRRDEIVMYFLKLARETLCEQTLRKNWDAYSNPTG